MAWRSAATWAWALAYWAWAAASWVLTRSSRFWAWSSASSSRYMVASRALRRADAAAAWARAVEMGSAEAAGPTSTPDPRSTTPAREEITTLSLLRGPAAAPAGDVVSLFVNRFTTGGDASPP